MVLTINRSAVRAIRRTEKRRFTQRKLNERQKRQVKRLVTRRKEKKYFDYVAGSTAIDTTGVVLGALCIPGQGTSSTQRVGDSIEVKSIHLRMQFTAGDATNFIRVVVFQWLMDSADDAPSIIELFADSTTNPANALLDYDTLRSRQMRIMYDKTYTMVVGANNEVRQVVKLFVGKKLGNPNLQFTPAGTNGTGHYYIGLISDSGAATHPTIRVNCRTIYTDS